MFKFCQLIKGNYDLGNEPNNGGEITPT
jgi:hypothetical protein